MKSKIPCLKNVLSETNTDVALLTETHLTEDKGPLLEGYTFFGKARQGRKGGGVGILVKNDKKSIIAPHYSSRDLEILWVSISRKLAKPLYIGTYYGKQETTCNKTTIQKEMDDLCEEILELGQEGEVVICMDANAKVGLLGEDVSRNGKLIQNVFKECKVEIMNGTAKCDGLITRQNRKRPEERSAIDLVAATYQASQWIGSMRIDEAGDFRMRGVNESDHNTIVIDVNISKIEKQKTHKRAVWNIKAPPEKFAAFREKLGVMESKAHQTMSCKLQTMTERYASWERLLYKSAISTIGKTTITSGNTPKTSQAIKTLREERKQKKKDFEMERCPLKKKERLKEYVEKQKEVKEQAVEEESERIKKRFEKMSQNGNTGNFWKERKKMKGDDNSSWLITKDENGNRIYDPVLNKRNIYMFFVFVIIEETVVNSKQNSQTINIQCEMQMS